MRLFSKSWLVVAGLVIPILLTLIMGILQYRASVQYGDSREWVLHTRMVLQTLQACLSNIQDAETGQRGFLLTRDESYLEPYRRALANSDVLWDNLRGLTSDNPVQQKNVDELTALVRTKLEELQETVVLEQQGNHTHAIEIVKTGLGKNVMDQIRAKIQVMHDNETLLLKKRQAIDDRNSRRNLALTSELVLFGVLFSAAVALLLYRLQKYQAMIKICAWSKMIEYEGQWLTVEEYLTKRLGVNVTHGMSDEEARKFARELEEEKRTSQP